jgi:uncharacterized protein (DUF305 family)
MSENGFHVHGAHDHAVEHGAHSGDSLASRIAVMTAILSTVGAVFSFQGGFTQNEALMHKNQSILYKNESVLKKTQASNQWNYYQAKSSKQNLAELAAAIVPAAQRQQYLDEVERYKKEKKEIQAEAEKLEADVAKYNALSDESDKKSAEAMHPHHQLAMAMTLIQIAISLASITVLTRKIWLFWGAGVAAGIGFVLWVTAGGPALLASLLH